MGWLPLHGALRHGALGRCTDSVTTEWEAGLAYQTTLMYQAAVSLCANHTPPTPEQACGLFGAGYPSTRGGYPAGCDEEAVLALFGSGPPTAAAVDKQCNRCGPTGYYARIAEFAAPLVGRIAESCRRDSLRARRQQRASLQPAPT